MTDCSTGSFKMFVHKQIFRLSTCRCFLATLLQESALAAFVWL